MEDLSKLKIGHIYHIGNGIYGVCAECNSLVKLNKWIFGGIHLCRSQDKSKTIEEGFVDAYKEE